MRWKSPLGTIEITPLGTPETSGAPADGLARGIAEHRRGRLDAAQSIYEAILRRAPGNHDALHLLGLVCHQRGQHQRALELMRAALQKCPNAHLIHSNCGEVLRALGAHKAAIEHYRRALELNPDYAEAHNNLGAALVRLNRGEEAMASFERAIACSMPYAPAHNNYANLLAERGEKEQAAVHYRRAIALKPDYAKAHAHLALVDPQATDLATVESLLQAVPDTSEDAADYHGALARLYEHSGDHDRAFEHHAAANLRRRRLIDYDPETTRRLVAQTIQVWTPDWWQARSAAQTSEQRPVFIVGMPRSGTTLVEQILSCHPKVFGAGELPALESAELGLAGVPSSAADFSERIQNSTEAAQNTARANYLSELGRGAGESARITDKMPYNFLRLGTARLLFPRARIIHCRRDPRDTGVSIFCTQFKDLRGNAFAFDQTEIGLYYREYERLMAHWRAVFGDDILEVHYEALLNDQEGISRKMIAHLGLDWDPGCLEFESNPRPVTTSSHAQVRRPLYRTSVARWERHAAMLTPLLNALGYTDGKHRK